jgi:hypothetical protein
MQPEDVFGLIVRTIGLLVALWGAWHLVFAIAQGANVTNSSHPTSAYAVSGVSAIVVGVGLLKAATALVAATYR